MTETMTQRHPLFVPGGPERLFRVGPVTRHQELTSSSMRTGAWMLAPGGEPCRGSLGVLADDILGYAVIAETPAGQWCVSTEISVDFCSRLPVDGSMLHGQSRTVELGPAGGLSRGRIVDAHGRTIAFGSERVRFIPATSPAQPSGDSPGPGRGPDPVRAWGRMPTPHVFSNPNLLSTPDLLRATTHRHEGGATLVLAATRELSNPIGNLHGGISLCASEIAGLAALQSDSHPLVTASVHIAYLRPGPVDGDVSFTATVLHRGRTLGLAKVVSYNAAGKACTIATVTAHRVT